MQAEALARDGRALSVDGLQRNEKKKGKKEKNRRVGIIMRR